MRPPWTVPQWSARFAPLDSRRPRVEEPALNDTRPSVIELIAKVTSHASDELKPEMDLIADLGVDSTKALQLLVEIEAATTRPRR
jgi:aryl carrier-like protein